jgi:predicted permease
MLPDLRYALRMLRKSPVFSAVAILSLALGIGANTAIFSLIDAVLLKMLPVADPQRLVALRMGGDSFTYPNYTMIRDTNTVFTGILGYSAARLNVRIDGQLEPAGTGQLVTGNYFFVLGVHAILGRTLEPDDDRTPGAHPVAVISYSFWQRRFNRDPGVLHRTIEIAGLPYTIIGVTPPEFFGIEVGRAPDITVPVMMQPQVMPGMTSWLVNERQTNNWLHLIGRLKPGVGAAQALASLQPAADQMNQEIARFMAMKFGNALRAQPQKLELRPGSKGLSELRRQFSQPLLVLMAVVGLVLLIACANVANLLLVRATARQREIAVRLALGAARFRLIRQLLTESLVLSTLGGLTGLLFARWSARLLLAFLPKGEVPVSLDLSPDARVLAFTLAVSVITGILFGLAPALRAARQDLNAALTQKQAIGLRQITGKLLVVSQVAFSLLLLVGAGLFLRTLANLRSQDAGFQPERILSVRLEPLGSDFKNFKLDLAYQDFLGRIRAIPGVIAASLGGYSPFSRDPWERGGSFEITPPITVDGRPNAKVHWIQVYPDYFASLGIPILRGRDLAAQDQRTSQPVAVVNETMARTLFPGRDPIGSRFLFAGDRQPIEIVGIVRDARYGSLREAVAPMFYQAFAQARTGRGQMTLHVRTANAASVAPAVLREMQELCRDVPTFEMQTLASQIDASLLQERLIATLCGFFAGLALLLASIGLYGLMAYAVARRTNEIGIRMALGAQRKEVVWMVLREVLALVGIGLAAGLPIALAATRLISGSLFGLSSADPLTLVVATAVMLAVAALAGYLPARRAARVDPMNALRYE